MVEHNYLKKGLPRKIFELTNVLKYNVFYKREANFPQRLI